MLRVANGVSVASLDQTLIIFAVDLALDGATAHPIALFDPGRPALRR